MCAARAPVTVACCFGIILLFICCGCLNTIFVASRDGYVNTRETGKGTRFEARIPNTFWLLGTLPRVKVIEVDRAVAHAWGREVKYITGLKITGHMTIWDALLQAITLNLYTRRTVVIRGEYHEKPPEILLKARRARKKARRAPKVTPKASAVPADAGAFTNTIGMKLVRIPAGTFLMGSPRTEFGSGSYERPQHRVRITKPFLMGATEVTQAQWKSIMGTNPSHTKGDGLPVEFASWHDARAFLKKLSAKEGRTYRLPTEAEWEYACRAGTRTRYSSGDDLNALQQVGWCRYDGGRALPKRPQPVASFRPNTWGLHDMHGNVAEWCQDRYASGYYGRSQGADPPGPARGVSRVLRGGSWRSRPEHCRSARRARAQPGFRRRSNGFRVVLELTGKER